MFLRINCIARAAAALQVMRALQREAAKGSAPAYGNDRLSSGAPYATGKLAIHNE